MKKFLSVFLSIFLCLVSAIASSETETTRHSPWGIPFGSTLEEVARLVYEETGGTLSFNPDGVGPMIITSDLPEAQAMGAPATALFAFDEEGGMYSYANIYFQESIDDYSSPFSKTIENKEEGVAICQESFANFSKMVEDYTATYGPLTGGEYLLDGHIDINAAYADMEYNIYDIGSIFLCEAELDNINLSFECYLDHYDDTNFVFVNVIIQYFG